MADLLSSFCSCAAAVHVCHLPLIDDFLRGVFLVQLKLRDRALTIWIWLDYLRDPPTATAQTRSPQPQTARKKTKESRSCLESTSSPPMMLLSPMLFEFTCILLFCTHFNCGWSFLNVLVIISGWKGVSRPRLTWTITSQRENSRGVECVPQPDPGWAGHVTSRESTSESVSWAWTITHNVDF